MIGGAMMKYKYLPGILFLVIMLLAFCSVQGLAFNTSQTLEYESSYLLSQERMNHTLTLNIDYFQEISDDIFLEGDLVIRTTSKAYAQPFIVGPNEVYLSGYNVIDNLDLKAGKIITRWGAADLFSPLDNFNPMPPGLSLTKKQDKLGVLGVSATYYLNDLTYLQGVLLPQLMPTPYPSQYLKDNYLANYGSVLQGQGISVDTVELAYQSAQDVIWGLRLNHSFPSFDAAISYYQGYYMEPFPANLSTKPNPSGTTMEITLGYPAKQVVGLEFQGEFPGIEGATLRGDLSYVVPESWEFQGDTMLDKPYLQAVIGADYTTNSNLYLNSGFIYGLPFERGNNCSPYLYLNAQQEIENCDFTPFYIGILSLSDMSMGNVIGLDFQITEDVTASFSYVFLLGDTKSKLGILERSKGLYFTLEWLF
jgi:hypothetical protein